MNTQVAVKNYRLHQWAAIIERKAESGQTVQEFCREAGISKDAYYYWQRRVREHLIETAGDHSGFIELPRSVQAVAATDVFIPQLTLQIGSVHISVNENTPRSLLQSVLEVVSIAE